MTTGTVTTTERRLPMTPARWLTLVLGVPVLLALIGGTGFNAVNQLASASFPVSYTFPSSHGQLTAQIESGSVTLRHAASVPAPVLTGTAHYTLVHPDFTHSGDTVWFHCPWTAGNCELNATLQVPATYAVSLSTDGGDVNLPGSSRDVTLDTGGGNLVAGTVSGGLNLDTGGGDASVDTLDGPPATLVTNGGNLVVLGMATSGTSTVDSGGGDVTLTWTKAPADLQISSGGGNVELVLPRGRYDFNTNSDGGSFSQPASDPRASDKITVQSGGGDITISEAP
jgi:hypothetical protein